MLREINLDEISDGKLYSSNDMARTDCKGCDGCSACCHGMGNSIVLDPLDVYRLSTNLSKSVNELLTGPLELNVVDGIILPNLKMARAEEACSFLDTNGRCTVHAFRPGICRMFPLGRFYENRSFQYFLQIHECPKTDRSQSKNQKWLDTQKINYDALSPLALTARAHRRRPQVALFSALSRAPLSALAHARSRIPRAASACLLPRARLSLALIQLPEQSVCMC